MPNRNSARQAITHHRALFISDLHLGAAGSKAHNILEFLKCCRAEAVYLVGDIFDLWCVGSVHWTSVHNEVVAELNRFSNEGAQLIYLVGNHDRYSIEAVQKYLPTADFRERAIHEAADNKTYLVMHGDQADRRLFRWHFMTVLGSRLDAILRGMDHRIAQNRPRGQKKIFGHLVDSFTRIAAMGERFETRLVFAANNAGADGVICGHSHRPGVRTHDGMIYANCGDWINSFTALTEDHKGQIELHWWCPEHAEVQRPAVAKPFSTAVGSGRPQEA